MPTVPRLTGPSVATAPLPGVRVAPTVAPALGPDLTAPLGAAAQLVEQERQKADQVRVNDADNQMTTARDHILYGAPGQPDSGLLAKQGENAFGAADDAIAQWNAAKQSIGATLNDRQRINFNNRIDGYEHDFHLEVQSHVLKERTQYDRDTTKQFVDARLGEAVRYAPNDPQKSDFAIQRLGAAVRDQRRRDGLDEDSAQQASVDAVSQARLEVLRQYHALGQDQSETAYLAQHRDEFVGRDLVDAELLTREGSTAGRAVRLTRGIVSGTYTPGILEAGNIDLVHRPRVANQDGSISTVRSISIEEDGKTILIPTVSPKGKILSNDDAIALYHKTGQQLGVFANNADADRYALELHARQERGIRTGDFEPTMSEALGQLDQELDHGRIDARVWETAERQIRQHYADKATGERQQSQQSFNAFGDAIEKNNGDLDTARRRDPQGWLRISLAERNALERRADDIRHPETKTDDAVFSHLTNLVSLNDSTREQFKSIDIVKEFGGRLSQPDLHHFLTLQANARITDDRAAQRQEDAQHRREEGQALRAGESRQRMLDQRAAMDSTTRKAMEKYQPLPRVVVPQWMIDAAKEDAEYKGYLERHGVDVDGAPSSTAATAPGTAAAPSTTPSVNVPGAAIVRLTPQQPKKP